MDVTFHENVIFYSPKSKELTNEESEGEPLPPIQSIPPPTYPGQQMMAMIKNPKLLRRS